ncbi:2-keto-3-deoxygluconate permease [Aerococcaceae bacterium INB8]|uniref:2-keto-3-deoxygluconate permease n=1 Tax=Ruoffia halotolerans TaxID=2748684 RepID=A0A839A2V4_9LACT|nr:2-keto-3-deoxygluconate permease [Ruoffia halotolerans]
MLKSINKIPSGTFLVPMILSAFIYTFWQELFHVGCLTEDYF